MPLVLDQFIQWGEYLNIPLLNPMVQRTTFFTDRTVTDPDMVKAHSHFKPYLTAMA